MNKFLKFMTAAAVSVSLLFSVGVPSVYSESVPAAGTSEAGGSSNTLDETPAVHSDPVVLDYTLTDSRGNRVTSITNTTKEVTLTLTIKDIGIKTSQLKNKEADIDFTKTLDDFSGTVDEKRIKITSKDDEPLTYTVVITGVKWRNTSSKEFNFMIGYSGIDSSYTKNGSVTIKECYVPEPSPSRPDDDDDYVVPQPVVRITADPLKAPIKAGDTGELTFTLKNIGDVRISNVLIEVTASEDTIITDGTASQEISYVSADKTRDFTVKYKALEKINNAKQTFSVSVSYFYDNGTNDVQVNVPATSVDFEAEVTVVEKVKPVIITEFNMSDATLEPDSEYSASVTIKNIGNADVNGAMVKFTGGNELIMSGGTGTKFFESIPQNGSRTMEIKFKTLKAFVSVRQDLSMNIKYSYTMGGEEIEDSYDETFTMFGHIVEETKEPETEPLPIITGGVFDEPLKAAKTYRYYVAVENKGSCDMENVQLNISSSDNINIIDGTSSVFAEKIAAGEKKSFEIMFQTTAEISSVKQSLTVQASYFYTSAKVRKQGEKSVTITLDSDISSAPILRMNGEKLPSAVVENTEYLYGISFTNYGAVTIRDVFVDFTATDSMYFLDGTEYAVIDIIRPNQTVDIKVKFKTTEKIASSKQGISAAIKYSYGRDSSILSAESSASVTIIAAVSKEEEENPETDSSAAPNIIIGNYDIGMDQVPAGDVFNLKIDFYNTNSSKGVENLIMTVNASENLSIYGGSNTFFYPTLGASGSISETVSLRALPTAVTGTASVSVSFKYDYMTGDTRNTVTSDQTIFIPVYQPDKMSFDVTVPTYSIYPGNETYITTTYLNKGKSEIGNVRAEIIGDIEALSTSKIIGNVAAGANGSFDFVVMPYNSGENTFTIKITYEDSMMNEISKEFPVTITVEEMYYPEDNYFPMTMEPMEPEGGGFPWIILWIGIGAVVVAGIVVLIIVLRKRKKKRSKLTEADINWEDDLDDVLSDKNDKTKV